MTLNAPVVAAAHASIAFFTTAAALLGALLLTWLVAEGRSIRDQRIAERSGQEVDDEGLRIRSLVPIAVELCLGLAVALRVQARGTADTWELVAVVMALGLGLLSVTMSLAMVTRPGRRTEGRRKWLGWLKDRGSVALAVAAGAVASQFVIGERVRLGGAKFAVYGTCLSGGCGLKQRTGPGPRHPELGREHRLADGSLVRVVCQKDAPAAPGYRSNVWNKLENGNWVSDAFVDTPNRSGGFSEGLPRCS